MADCIVCHLRCANDEALERHWDQWHPSLASLNRSVKSIQASRPAPLPHCPQCDATFPTIKAWSKHVHCDASTSEMVPCDTIDDGQHDSYPLLSKRSTASATVSTFFYQLKPKQVMAKLKRRNQWSYKPYSVI
ncbi:uncharacterized protein ARMOST_05717 [Armillaria ostoyae]|uniref:Uncharacterized protein n=1 Tax=Armillaria ostoyae TaxID=47428 RepID=A0A284R0Z5_ARMOS|nr:uncharacterized protein ARMOST_05717 [Armillaria ostoyae]